VSAVEKISTRRIVTEDKKRDEASNADRIEQVRRKIGVAPGSLLRPRPALSSLSIFVGSTSA
jgi:hypothetical protein